MWRWWKLAWNSKIRFIWFLLFIGTSLSVVILDIDPRAFIFISVIIGTTIYQNSQRALSLYLNQCQVVSCQPEPTTKSEFRSTILQLVHSIHFNKSTYPCCRIESCTVLSYCVSPSFFKKWKRFYNIFKTFHLLRCVILLPMLLYANALLEQQKRIKAAWLDILHNSYKS